MVLTLNIFYDDICILNFAVFTYFYCGKHIYMRKPDKLHELNWWSDKIYAKMEILLLSTYPISQESHHNDDEDDGCYDEDDDDQENFKVSTFPICQAGLTIPCVCHNFSNFETPISMWIGLHVKSVKLKIEIKKL